MNRIKEVKKERCYDGFLKIDKYYFKQEKNDGTWTEEFTREVVLRRNAVAILIHDEKNDLLLFTKQFRPGAYTQGEPFICEMVAGLIDEGEDINTTIIREVQEEVGLNYIENLKLISSYYPSCGSCTEKVFLYYANADLSNVGKWGGCHIENEIIEIITISVEEAFNWQKEGLIGTANGHVALNWLKYEIALK